MLSVKHHRRWLLVISAVIAAGALVGGVVAAQSRDADVPAEVATSLAQDPLVHVMDIPAAEGRSRRGIFVQRASAGYFCTWDAPSATSKARLGGCHESGDPLGGKALSVNFTFDGGPAISTVTDARLFGLVAGKVASAVILMTDGSRRPIQLHPVPVNGVDLRAFGYRLRVRDLRSRVTPTAVIALDANGTEIDRQATGF